MAENPLLQEHAAAMDIDECVEDIRRSLQRECRLASPTSVQEMEEFRPIQESVKDSCNEAPRSNEVDTGDNNIENEAPASKKIKL